MPLLSKMRIHPGFEGVFLTFTGSQPNIHNFLKYGHRLLTLNIEVKTFQKDIIQTGIEFAHFKGSVKPRVV